MYSENPFHSMKHLDGSLEKKDVVSLDASLDSAKKIERLGGGQTASVWKMETEIDHKPFYFARKQFQSGNRFQITREQEILQAVQGIEGVPKLLQAKETWIDMELVSGISLGKLPPGKRREIPRSSVLDLFHSLVCIASRNVVNSDLNVNNILYDNDTKKLSLIDFGGAVLHKEGEPKRDQLKFMLLGLKKLFPGFSEFDSFYERVVKEREKEVN